MSLTKNQPIQEHLKYSFSGGVALTLVILLSYLCINLTGKIAELFFLSAFPDLSVTKDFSLGFVVGTGVALMLSIVLLSPLRLNIKSWYQHTNDGGLPLTTAFSYFANLKKYFLAVNFCVWRFIVLFIVFLVPLLPSIVLSSIMSYGVNRDGFSSGSSFGAIAILAIILFILGLIFSLYFAVGYFFADFIFVKGIEANPFKAMAMSRKIARKNRESLLITIATTLPYYFLCIFLITIPFAIPRIRTALAVYADVILY